MSVNVNIADFQSNKYINLAISDETVTNQKVLDLCDQIVNLGILAQLDDVKVSRPEKLI